MEKSESLELIDKKGKSCKDMFEEHFEDSEMNLSGSSIPSKVLQDDQSIDFFAESDDFSAYGKAM